MTKNKYKKYLPILKNKYPNLSNENAEKIIESLIELWGKLLENDCVM